LNNTNKQFIGFLTCLLFCAGCIEYEESLIIKKNGSGTINMAYGMPLEMVENDKSFSAEKIKNDLSGIEGVTVLSTKDFEKDELKWVSAIARFISLESLGNIKNEQLPAFAGAMTYTDNGDGSFTFTKTLGEEPKESKPDREKDMTMMKGMVGDVTWDYEINFPMNILDIQFNHGKVDFKGKKVTWSVPLAEFVGGTSTLTVKLGMVGRMESSPKRQTVILKNGKRIYGEVVNMTKTHCLVIVEKKRERIERDNIKSIEF
jgi:hypothetical protein